VTLGPFSVDLNELDTMVNNLHASSWSGEAAAAHLEAHRRWAAGAKDMNDGLIAIRDAAKHAHERYSTAASVNHRMTRG
jgi:WXG100 family type VII secretion target